MQGEAANYSPIYKVILAGESGVGKTSLLSMYVKGICPNTFPTIAVEFCTKEIQMADGSVAKAQLWDTAGQERFKSLANTYYRKALGVLLLFDVTSQATFESCANILRDIRNNSNENIVIYLVGNKIDLEEERVVPTSKAEEFARNEKINYIETSAVKGLGVKEAFGMMLNDVHKIYSKTQEDYNRQGTIDLDKDKKENCSKDGSLCC